MQSLKLPLFVLALWLGTNVSTALLAMGGARSANTASLSRHALVIGNSSYKFTAPLANPARDARLVAAALKNAGFKVYLHTDLSQKQMKRMKQGLEMIKNKRVSALLALQKSKKATHQPRPRSPYEDCQLFPRKDGRDLYCVSSVLRSKNPRKYGVSSLLDDTDYTAWIEGKPGPGMGEWVLVDFGELRKIDKITIRNGYNKNRDTYFQNGRLKSLSLKFSSGDWKIIPVKDKPDLQTLKIPKNIAARWVQIKFWNIAKGQETRNTGLNQLRVTSSPLGK